MEKLAYLKETRGKLYNDGKDRYIERLSQFLKQGDTKSVFKDDLVNLIAFAENTDHLDMIEDIAVNAKDDNTSQIGTWGSAVMRLYYSLNEMDRAYENMKNVDKFGEFFNQRTSYQVLMTMLFKAARYQHVIEVYEMSTSRLNAIDPAYQRDPTDRRLTIIAFAAYAKMNTPEALEAANRLYAKDPHNRVFKARTVSFLAYLAMKQNQPVMALNLLSDHPNKNYITAREIKTIALQQLKRYEDVLYHLRDCLNSTRRDVMMLLQETCTILQNASSEIDDEQVKNDLIQTLADLKEENLVGNDTLESIVFKEIDRRPREAMIGGFNAMQSNQQGRFENRPHRNRDNFGGAGGGSRPMRPNYSRFQDDADSGFGQSGSGGNQMQQQGRRNWQNNRNNYSDNNYQQNQRRRPQAKSYFENENDDFLDEDLEGMRDNDKRFR